MTRIIASAMHTYTHTRGIDQLYGSLEVVPRYVYQKFQLWSGNLLEIGEGHWSRGSPNADTIAL